VSVPEKAEEKASTGSSAKAAVKDVKDMFEDVNKLLQGHPMPIAGGVSGPMGVTQDMSEIISTVDDTLSQMQKIREGLLKLNEASKITSTSGAGASASAGASAGAGANNNTKSEKSQFMNFDMPSFPLVEGFENAPRFAPF
jgi:hypothetical protein